MSSRNVNGQPRWTKVSVTIDYLLVLLHITPSFVWFMQAQVETQGLLCQMSGFRWLGRFLHTKTRAMHSRRYACNSPNKNHFPKSEALPLVGSVRRCRVNTHSEGAPFSCTWSRLCWRPKYLPPQSSVCTEGAPHNCSLSTSQPNLPSDWMSSAVIVTSIGVSPWVRVPSTARATLRDHHWLMQWPLEGLLAWRSGRGSACGLPLPHFLRLYAYVVDLLLGAQSTA